MNRSNTGKQALLVLFVAAGIPAMDALSAVLDQTPASTPKETNDTQTASAGLHRGRPE